MLVGKKAMRVAMIVNDVMQRSDIDGSDAVEGEKRENLA